MGVFDLSYQLSNFSKIWGMQGSEKDFHEFHWPIPIIFAWKHIKCLVISYETMICGMFFLKKLYCDNTHRISVVQEKT